jgi:hypothetical protein
MSKMSDNVLGNGVKFQVGLQYSFYFQSKLQAERK